MQCRDSLGRVNINLFLFENGGLALRLHVSGKKAHRKRIFPKTLSRVEIFNNDLVDGWNRVFLNDDVTKASKSRYFTCDNSRAQLNVECACSHQNEYVSMKGNSVFSVNFF